MLLLLALALAAALLLGWAPLAAGFEDEEDDETDKTDVPIDLSIKAYEVSFFGVCVCSGVVGDKGEGGI